VEVTFANVLSSIKCKKNSSVRIAINARLSVLSDSIWRAFFFRLAIDCVLRVTRFFCGMLSALVLTVINTCVLRALLEWEMNYIRTSLPSTHVQESGNPSGS